jgi:hypothetical protein
MSQTSDNQRAGDSPVRPNGVDDQWDKTLRPRGKSVGRRRRPTDMEDVRQEFRASDQPISALHWHLVNPDGRAADVVAFEEAVIAFFLESATLLGIPKSVAAISAKSIRVIE